jgi:hypothetical protein
MYRLGFTHVELNHQVDSAMLEGPGLGQYQFSSVHEPCPADVPVPALKEHNWLVSATDEESRQQGVRMVKRSINLACDLGAKVVILHAGEVNVDAGLEIQLRRLFEAGQVHTPEYLEVKEKLVKARALQNMPAVTESAWLLKIATTICISQGWMKCKFCSICQAASTASRLDSGTMLVMLMLWTNWAFTRTSSG